MFLLPGALQVDLSVTPTSQFAPRGDTFRLLFGAANEPVVAGPCDSTDTYGHAVHHAVRARVCIERGRAIQAEYWISSLRNETLALASRRAGVQDWHARGAHLLSAKTRERFADALVCSLSTAELSRALNATIGLLLDQSDQAPALAARVENHLRGPGDGHRSHHRGPAHARSRYTSSKTTPREATWRERALNAEQALKAAYAEVLAQRTRIGELLGQIRDLEAE